MHVEAANADDAKREAGKVHLSYFNARHQETVPLLYIPHNVLVTLSTRPRKWLCYAAYTICGVVGALFSCDEHEELSAVDLEGDVNENDHFVYRFSDAPKFVDPQARGPKRSSQSVSTRSREGNSDVRDYYGGCPFSRIPDGSGCHCCHLIPHSKGDDVSKHWFTRYMQDIYIQHFVTVSCQNPQVSWRSDRYRHR